MIRLARRVTGWWWRRTRSIKPTRDGWWCVFAAIGLGVAAVNTGNNLAYLLCSMLLALIMASGFLSDLTVRGLRVHVTLPEAFHAGQPALVMVGIANAKRRLASYSIQVEALDRPAPRPRRLLRRGPARTLDDWLGVLGLKDRRGIGAPRRLAYVPQLGPRAERMVAWEVTLPARGRRRLPRLRASTGFPFGLFVKTSPPLLFDESVLVYPAVHPVTMPVTAAAGAGDASARRRGRGHDLYNLRPYRAGDEPHLIHWRTTARAGTLTVRELEEDTTEDTRIVVTGAGVADAVRVERALSRAASLAVHLLRRGVAVELAGAAGHVPLGRGAGQERRILTALALHGAPGHVPPPDPPVTAAAMRELRVSLDAAP